MNAEGIGDWYTSSPVTEVLPKTSGSYKMSETEFDNNEFTEVIAFNPDTVDWVEVRRTSGLAITAEKAFSSGCIPPSGDTYMLKDQSDAVLTDYGRFDSPEYGPFSRIRLLVLGK